MTQSFRQSFHLPQNTSNTGRTTVPIRVSDEKREGVVECHEGAAFELIM